MSGPCSCQTPTYLLRTVLSIAQHIHDGFGAAMTWVRETALPMWEGLKVGVLTFAEAVVGPVLNAWESLKSQAGESHGILTSFAQTWRYIVDEVVPLVKQQFSEAGQIMLGAFSGLLPMIGGLEGAWASLNIAFNGVVELMVRGLEKVFETAKTLFGFLAKGGGVLWL